MTLGGAAGLMRVRDVALAAILESLACGCLGTTSSVRPWPRAARDIDIQELR